MQTCLYQVYTVKQSGYDAVANNFGILDSSQDKGNSEMKVFLSHIHEEAPLALVFNDWIESSFPSLIQVFVSSDIKDIPAGKKWFDEINKALGDSQAFIVLCSPNSIKRSWINFETGCAWIKDVPVIVICHSGQSITTLPRPLSDFQALTIDDLDFIDKFLSSLAQYLELEKIPRIDKVSMLSEISNAIDSFEPLSNQVSEKAESSSNFEEIEDQILKCIAESQGLSVSELAQQFEMNSAKMEYHLDNLVEHSLVRYTLPSAFTPKIYSTEKMGRKYLVEKNLL